MFKVLFVCNCILTLTYDFVNSFFDYFKFIFKLFLTLACYIELFELFAN